MTDVSSGPQNVTLVTPPIISAPFAEFSMQLEELDAAAIISKLSTLGTIIAALGVLAPEIALAGILIKFASIASSINSTLKSPVLGQIINTVAAIQNGQPRVTDTISEAKFRDYDTRTRCYPDVAEDLVVGQQDEHTFIPADLRDTYVERNIGYTLTKVEELLAETTWEVNGWHVIERTVTSTINNIGNPFVSTITCEVEIPNTGNVVRFGDRPLIGKAANGKWYQYVFSAGNWVLSGA